MVSCEFLKDIQWWSKFVVQYNVISMVPMTDWSKPDEILASDACLVGAGGWFNGKYFHCSFPEFIQAQSPYKCIGVAHSDSEHQVVGQVFERSKDSDIL